MYYIIAHPTDIVGILSSETRKVNIRLSDNFEFSAQFSSVFFIAYELFSVRKLTKKKIFAHSDAFNDSFYLYMYIDNKVPQMNLQLPKYKSKFI